MLNLSDRAKPKVVCYAASQIPDIWPEARPHIKRALDRGSRYTLDEVYEGLCGKRMQLWTWQDTEIHGCLVTTIQIKRDTKYCLLLALGGSQMDQWLRHFHLVEDWARGEGCTEMRIYGRIGWSKLLNYRVDYARMSRSL